MSTQPRAGDHSSVGILGTGSYVPKEEVTNDWVAEKTGVTPEWIERKTQITARRYAAPTEATSDLAIKAAIEALGQAELAPEQVDYLIVATSTPDSPQPPTAALVQHELGVYGAACFDVNVVCSGFGGRRRHWQETRQGRCAAGRLLSRRQR
ncbi:3-oxoacyl-ACP synthase III family protein [Prauserella muralis]|uniref:Uncharacterized protein n=1 Tax=Prauserella muralis TaxID=588067 RepID=A0A2V4AHQ3_9PSEU|nr:hypothetical protein [Prauserella muralis]PXY19445.1 hypothetical protein BAY60_32410 [Prauserella muralis]TWE29422.1 hypothetical protein FHX69_2107 [Prauserella muralis]